MQGKRIHDTMSNTGRSLRDFKEVFPEKVIIQLRSKHEQEITKQGGKHKALQLEGTSCAKRLIT